MGDIDRVLAELRMELKRTAMLINEIHRETAEISLKRQRLVEDVDENDREIAYKIQRIESLLDSRITTSSQAH